MRWYYYYHHRRRHRRRDDDDDDVNCYVSIREFPELVYVLNTLPVFVYCEEIKTC